MAGVARMSSCRESIGTLKHTLPPCLKGGTMLRKCSVCEREFAASYELNRHYTTVCPECQAIDEPRRELANLIEKVWKEYQNLQDQYRKLTGKEHGWLR